MKVTTVFALISSILGVITAASISTSTRLHPALQKRGQTNGDSRMTIRQLPNRTSVFESTQTLQDTTSMPSELHTSISVHTVVRNKPAFLSPHTESSLMITSPTTRMDDYSYTYEDVSDDDIKFSAPLTTKTPPRSYWNSQKAQLDARRQQSAKKYPSTYHKQVDGSSRTTLKPGTSYKAREKPKFGTLNKSFKSFGNANDKVESKNETKPQEFIVPESNNSTSTTTENIKSVKNSNNDLNLAEQKVPTKEESVKPNQKQTSQPIGNQIVGRVGEIPIQIVQGQPQFRQGSIANAAGIRPSKFDETMGGTRYVDNSANYQQQQQPFRNNNNQFNSQPGNVFIQATPPVNNGGRVVSASNPIVSNIQQNSNLSPRLGSLGLNLGGGGGSGGLGVKLPGLGNGGFQINLGSVPDPITFVLKLLSLIPRPLLNLNSRIIFGIELGNNFGLTSGGAKG